MSDKGNFLNLIDAMPRLTELYILKATHFANDSWYLLKARAPHHLETLRIVRAGWCGVSSVALVDMLCSLPSLEVFQADNIVDRSYEMLLLGPAGEH